MSIEYQIVYWRDIPAQVKVRSGRQRAAQQLPERFQEAIDAAAMAGRTTDTDSYLEEWRSTDWETAEGELESFAGGKASELEKQYPPERLKALAANRGYEAQ